MNNKTDDSFDWIDVIDGLAFLIVVYFYIRPVGWMKKLVIGKKEGMKKR